MTISRGKTLLTAGLCLFLLAGCSSIDKALYDLTNSVTSVDRVTGEREVNLYSRASQIQKSDQQTEQLIAQTYTNQGKPINEQLDMDGYKRVQEIFRKIHLVSHMRDEDWQVVLIPEDSFNAFVTGGTYVIVHKGLIDELKSDDELAYVIGHEIAHVAANHVYESQTYNIGAMLAGSKSAKRSSFQAAFTHEYEEEADRIGLLYAALAGYNPEAAAQSWERKGDEVGYHATNYSTHPIAKERAANNAKYAEIYKQYYIPGQVNPDYKAILANNPVFGNAASASGAQPGEGAGVGALLESTMNVLSTKQQAKQEEARQTNRIQFIQYVGQNLRLVSRQAQSSNDVVVTMQYKGQYPLSELVLKGKLGDEIVIAKVTNVIAPNAQFSAVFHFPKGGVTPEAVNTLQIGLDYAEQASQ